MKKTLLFVALTLLLSSNVHSQINFKDSKAINSAIGGGSYDMASGNLDSDILKDLIVVNRNTNTIEHYKNDLDNSENFIKQPNITNTLNTILGVAIADFNGDGFNDIVATGGGNRKVAWYPNNGSGVFAIENIITDDILGSPVRVVTGTIDGNTSIDIAVADFTGNAAVWFANDGSGTFSGPNTIGLEPANSGTFDLDLADYDGDGDTDVVVGNFSSSIISVYDNLLVQNGNGIVSFQKYTNEIDKNELDLIDVDFADVNDDDIIDIIGVAIGGPAIPTYYTRSSNAITTDFIANDLTTTLTRFGAVEVADFNNDGFNDVALSSSQTTGNDLVILESNNDGTFKTEVSLAEDLKGVYAITVNDFGNDGDLDIATAGIQASAVLNFFLNDLNNLSIGDPNLNNIVMYPNPTTNRLNFKGLDNFNHLVSIYNNLGQKIIDSVIDINSQVDVSNLARGLYFLRFKDVDGTFKFIKN